MGSFLVVDLIWLLELRLRDGITLGIYHSLIVQSLDGLLTLAEVYDLLFQRILLLLESLGLLKELLSILLEATFKLSNFFHLLSRSFSLRIIFHHVS